MHNPDDKYLTLLGFDPSTSDFRATTVPNEQSESAVNIIELTLQCID